MSDSPTSQHPSPAKDSEPVFTISRRTVHRIVLGTVAIIVAAGIAVGAFALGRSSAPTAQRHRQSIAFQRRHTHRTRPTTTTSAAPPSTSTTTAPSTTSTSITGTATTAVATSCADVQFGQSAAFSFAENVMATGTDCATAQAVVDASANDAGAAAFQEDDFSCPAAMPVPIGIGGWSFLCTEGSASVSFLDMNH